MSELPKLISDLALILIVAGVVTVVFKRLKQPLVLGYIVAGFLASPHMPYTPSVSDEQTIHVWSQLGVIFLMFSLGLEFSFKKILKNGVAPIFTAGFIMACMMVLGCAVGKSMGLNPTNYVFLGGMLCMSSTTIIYKAYADMGVSNKRFAGRVLSVLVLEDILGIVLMALLSSFAEGGGQQTKEIIGIVSSLTFFLLLWFLVGIWLIPSLLRRYSTYINKETLMIVSIGLCFLMVVIADRFGYSSALGAFVMGSIMSETIEAERIEESIASVKDLFGAIFFVSVGMMVEPAQLMENWLMILVLVATIVGGQIVFGSLGYLLSGSSLISSLQSGFSMAQIGEFSFIIASMGIAAGLIEGFIYPVIVAVSIITTFLTPYLIRLALQFKFGTQKRERRQKEEKRESVLLTTSKAWKTLLKDYLIQTAAYGTLSVSVIRLLFISLLLVCRKLFTHWPGNFVCGVLTLMLLSLFLRPIVMRKNNSMEAKFIRQQGGAHRFLFYVTVLLRMAVAVAVVYYIFNFLSPLWWELHVVLSIVVVLLMLRSKWTKRTSVRMERTFMYNLRRREELIPQGEEPLSYARRLRGRDMHITQLALPEGTTWGGKTLAQLHIGGKNGVHVTAIIRDHSRLNIPGGGTLLFPHDVIEVAGDDRSIDELKNRMDAEVNIERQTVTGMMQLQRMVVRKNSAMEGLFIKYSGIRDKYRCMVVGFEEKDGTLTVASADHRITCGDVMWVAGEYDDLNRLKDILGGK